MLYLWTFKVLQKKSSAQDNEMYPLFKENREYNSNRPPMIGDLPGPF